MLFLIIYSFGMPCTMYTSLHILSILLHELCKAQINAITHNIILCLRGHLFQSLTRIVYKLYTCTYISLFYIPYFKEMHKEVTRYINAWAILFSSNINNFHFLTASRDYSTYQHQEDGIDKTAGIRKRKQNQLV